MCMECLHGNMRKLSVATSSERLIPLHELPTNNGSRVRSESQRLPTHL